MSSSIGNKHRVTYSCWWEGRLCRLSGSRGPFKRVLRVVYLGSVYGHAYLHYEDGTSEAVRQWGAFRPRKKDVEVKEG